jgi:hypothetical protein
MVFQRCMQCHRKEDRAERTSLGKAPAWSELAGTIVPLPDDSVSTDAQSVDQACKCKHPPRDFLLDGITPAIAKSIAHICCDCHVCGAALHGCLHHPQLTYGPSFCTNSKLLLPDGGLQMVGK